MLFYIVCIFVYIFCIGELQLISSLLAVSTTKPSPATTKPPPTTTKPSPTTTKPSPTNILIKGSVILPQKGFYATNFPEGSCLRVKITPALIRCTDYDCVRPIQAETQQNTVVMTLGNRVDYVIVASHLKPATYLVQ